MTTPASSIRHAIRLVEEVSGSPQYPGAERAIERLTLMLQVVEGGEGVVLNLYDGYLGRLVVDSWPLGSPAGNAVVAAERAFLENESR